MFGRKKPVTAARDTSASDEAQGSGPAAPGPHDRSAVGDVREYYEGLGFGHIDLGAMAIGVPKGRDLNVALDPNGQPEFHVVTQVSRVIPRAFAAPKSAGQWRTMVASMREQLEEQGADVTVVDGPWGRELVAEMPGAVFRAIGVDGNRWTAEVRIMATPELAEQAAVEGREVFEHLLINRGEEPMPVKEQLPLTIPDEIRPAAGAGIPAADGGRTDHPERRPTRCGTTSGAGRSGAGSGRAGTSYGAATSADPGCRCAGPGRRCGSRPERGRPGDASS